MNARRFLVGTALACVLGGIHGPAARATEPGDTPSRTLRYREIELTHAQSAHRLYARIRSTAEQVCAPHDGAALERKQRFAACRSSTIDRAVAELNAPLVSALHAGGSRRLVSWSDSPRSSLYR